jgi:type II secretory pathway pseudopilin PulG
MELLVVLAIITILVAILAPVLWTARNKAHSTVCLSNLKQLGMSTLQYADDWDETLPFAPGDPSDGSVNPAMIPNAGILPARDLLNLDPSQSSYLWGALTQRDKSLKREMFQCPNDNGAPDFGYPRGEPVWGRALTSYLWDPDQLPGVRNARGGESPASVNGASLGGIRDASTARLMQDYGSVWHTELASSVQQGVRLRVGLVNVVFADSHVKSVLSGEQSAQAASSASAPAIASSSAEPSGSPQPMQASPVAPH